MRVAPREDDRNLAKVFSHVIRRPIVALVRKAVQLEVNQFKSSRGRP